MGRNFSHASLTPSSLPSGENIISSREIVANKGISVPLDRFTEFVRKFEEKDCVMVMEEDNALRNTTMLLESEIQ